MVGSEELERVSSLSNFSSSFYFTPTLRPPTVHMYLEKEVEVREDGVPTRRHIKLKIDECMGIRLGELTCGNIKYSMMLMLFEEMTDQVS